jgi:aminoglycoside phosphotransferase (APT) family kinase protein
VTAFHGQRLLAKGFGSEVYETPKGLILRKPLTGEARESYARQCRFLPRLGSFFHFPVPQPSSFGDFMSYPKLQGEPLEPGVLNELDAAAIAVELANFMAALHSIPLVQAVEWGVPSVSRTTLLLAAADRVIPKLPVNLQRDVHRWRDSFREPDHQKVVIHGDLWYGNILVDRQTGCLSGVLDFDDTSIGDAAWDLATQLHLGRSFTALVLEAYPLEKATMLERAEALFALRPFEQLDWAYRQGNTAEFEEGLEKLYLAGVLPDTGMTWTTTTPCEGTSAE